MVTKKKRPLKEALRKKAPLFGGKRGKGGGERKTPIQKAKEKPKSLRLAVNGKCFDCVGAGADPSWQWLVGNCQLKNTCPLWNVRPHQKKEGAPMPHGIAVSLGLTKKSRKAGGSDEDKSKEGRCRKPTITKKEKTKDRKTKVKIKGKENKKKTHPRKRIQK